MIQDPVPGRLMAAEIAEQPAVLARLLAEGSAAAQEVATQVRRDRPRCVVLAARGSSDHAALYAKYLLEITLGLPVGLASPSTTTVYGARPDYDGVLWVAVSQSGGSPDLVESTATARDCGALTLAVTNAPGSPLAEAAALHLDVLAGPERAVAATKSFSAQMLALWLLVQHWAEADVAAADPLPGLAEETLAAAGVDGLAQRYRFVDKLVVTGRGYSHPVAREAALKLMETSFLSAHAFSGADLLHGPMAMVDHDRPVLAVASDGPGGTALEEVLDRLAERGADVCLVGSHPGRGPEVPQVRVPSVREDLSAVLEVLPLQRLAHTLALSRGSDPDAPRGLSKVTRTW